MSLLTLESADQYLHFDEERCREAGKALAAEYQHATPFPHIVIDDFLPKSMLLDVAANYPDTASKSYFDRDQERLKFQFNPREIDHGVTRNLLSELNSLALLAFLEEMTGIKGLIPDPHFEGGGLHLTKRGGHLGIHADFNRHGVLKVERRLNLLVYLNDGWMPEYGGALELWDADMTHAVKRVEPLIGRCVVFSTDAQSYHGHPEPLACPPDRDRRSIATYYYTAAPTADLPMSRSTDFRVRPGTSDRPDWTTKAHHFVSDWVPPRLQSTVLRLLR